MFRAKCSEVLNLFRSVPKVGVGVRMRVSIRVMIRVRVMVRVRVLVRVVVRASVGER